MRSNAPIIAPSPRPVVASSTSSWPSKAYSILPRFAPRDRRDARRAFATIRSRDHNPLYRARSVRPPQQVFPYLRPRRDEGRAVRLIARPPAPGAPLLAVVRFPACQSHVVTPILCSWCPVAGWSRRRWQDSARLHQRRRRLFVYARFSGNSPGIQRGAKVAGKARCKGLRGPSLLMAPRSMRAETMRRAWRSPASTMAAASLRGSSPR